MSTKIGIVGMPNAGKSSLFNALTKAGAEAANYPFTTIEPNVAVVPVRDVRMEEVVKTVGASSIVWDTIDFHDIAGLVAGAHEGEGLGNKFLANIRETDAIVHVVRAHGDENVIHPDGRVDPLADIETIETELVLADLETAEKRVERVAKQAKGGERVAIAEEAWLRKVIEELTKLTEDLGTGVVTGAGGQWGAMPHWMAIKNMTLMAEEVMPHFREPDGKPMWAKEERLGKHTLTEHAAVVGEPAIAPSIPWGENGQRIDPRIAHLPELVDEAMARQETGAPD